MMTIEKRQQETSDARERALVEEKLQRQAFEAHANTQRALKAAYDAMTPAEREAAAHKRVVERGRALHARGLPHNCLCHEAV